MFIFMKYNMLSRMLLIAHTDFARSLCGECIAVLLLFSDKYRQREMNCEERQNKSVKL